MDDLISRQATMDFISAIPFVENHPHKESKVKCVLRLPCRNGEFAVDEDLLADLTHTYPDMDVRKSLQKIVGGMTRF